MDIKKAKAMLLNVSSILEKEGIEHTLEGGTLLGIVRDNELLSWDYDLDLAIKNDSAELLNRIRWKFYLKGYRVTMRRYVRSYGPIKAGDYRIFKVKPLGLAFLKIFSRRFEDRMLILDIFVKKSDPNFIYWQAKGKIMRVDKCHYDGVQWIDYNGRRLAAPQDYEKYLTAKYGDWSIPVKEWNCKEDELSIVCDVTSEELV